MRDVALEEIKEYAAEDADVTFQLKELFAVELENANQQIIRRY
jgi:DNA polymerase-1